MPATVMAVQDVPARVVVDDPLMDDPSIRIRSIAPLRASDAGMGIEVLLDMPVVAWPRLRRGPTSPAS